MSGFRCQGGEDARRGGLQPRRLASGLSSLTPDTRLPAEASAQAGHLKRAFQPLERTGALVSNRWKLRVAIGGALTLIAQSCRTICPHHVQAREIVIAIPHGAAFEATHPWVEYSVDTRLTHQNRRIIQFSTTEYSHRGGAHPNSRTIHRIFDKHTQVELGIGDLFETGKTNELADRIETRIQRSRGFPSLEKMKEEYLDKKKRFAPGNMFFKHGKVCFHYNTYALFCFAAGQTDVEFRTGELADLLKPGARSLIEGKP